MRFAPLKTSSGPTASRVWTSGNTAMTMRREEAMAPSCRAWSLSAMTNTGQFLPQARAREPWRLIPAYRGQPAIPSKKRDGSGRFAWRAAESRRIWDPGGGGPSSSRERHGSADQREFDQGQPDAGPDQPADLRAHVGVHPDSGGGVGVHRDDRPIAGGRVPVQRPLSGALALGNPEPLTGG